MGVLDDAIREHLELRRKHGAGSDEIARKEAEALGPARREVGAEADGAEVVPIESAAGAPADLPPAEPVADPSIAALEALPEEAPGAELPPLDEALEADLPAPADAELEPPIVSEVATESAAAEELVEAEEQEPAPEPAAVEEVPPARAEAETAPAPAREEPHTTDTPPRGFEAVPAEPEADADAEDVLEETPDFLQETPEHDRLWFEQKPPRDFDFDE